MPRVVIETPRLLLREFTPDDTDDLAALYADPDVMRFFDRTRTRGEAEEEIRRAREWYRSAGWYLWATFEKPLPGEARRGPPRGAPRPAFVGRCGILPQHIDGRDEYEIAWMIARSRWGRGYATEAARAIRDHGFARFGFDRMVSIIDARNAASIRVAEKTGMRYERDALCQGYVDRMYVVKLGDG